MLRYMMGLAAPGWQVFILLLGTLELRCDGSATDLLDLLTSLANDGLGVQKMQDHLDSNVKYSSLNVDGAGLIQEISTGISSRLSNTEQVVKRIKSQYETSYSSLTTTSSYFDCCSPPHYVSFQYDDRMKGDVNKDYMCYVGVGSKKSTTAHLNNAVLSTMKENYVQQGMTKWQYVATEDGILYIYPASKSCLFNSDTFDPRFRSWYVETATPKPKNVVLVIDHSYSMTSIAGGHSLMHIAREAAKTVVDTLNPNDAVGVVKFSSKASVPVVGGLSTCYSNSLSQATPKNKENLKKMINTITASGGTIYADGLNEAFKLLMSDDRVKTGKRDGVILFLTDGQPQDSLEYSIKPSIINNNVKMNNKTVLLTFGIGNAKELDILAKMAALTHTVQANGSKKVGTFTAIQNPDDLRSKMATYYNFYPQSTDGTTITVPYFDGFGLGLITSFCSPLVTSDTLRGVACADISLSELLDGVSFFRPSELSYAFIVDNHGRLMSHPLLPKLYDYSEQPLFVDMLDIEISNGAKTVKQSMLSDGSGNMSITATRVVSRGDSIHDGVTTKTVTSDYFWAPITNSNYSACIVIGRDDRIIEYSATQAVSSFLYHRLDLQKPDDMCNHVNQLGVKDKTSVKFNPYAFRNPNDYLAKKEDTKEIDKYGNIMTGKISDSSVFKVGVKEVVAATAAIDQIWLAAETIEKSKNYSAWKYIGSANGVFRMFPASPLYKQFDHTNRPWYRKAMSSRGQYVVTPPYNDAGGSGIIMTLAKTLYEGSNTAHSTSDVVFGVMGIDFTMFYFQVLLHKAFPDCEETNMRCFVMDNSGYLIFHPDFTSNGQNVNHIHIIEKEPEIAKNLIQNGHMTRHACVDIASVNDHFFWTVEVSAGNAKVTNPVHYELITISGTNLFVGKISTSSSSNNCLCMTPANTAVCKSRVTSFCECPCKTPSTFSHCLNAFPVGGDQYPVCVPDSPPVTDSATLGNAIAKTLDVCFDYKCSAIPIKSECNLVVGCSWCTTVADGSALDTPVCRKRGQCPTKHTNDSNGGMIAGIVIAVLVVIGVMVGVYIYMKKHHVGKRPGACSSTGVPTTTSQPAPSAPAHHYQDHSTQPFNPAYTNQAFYDPGQHASYIHPAPPPYTA